MDTNIANKDFNQSFDIALYPETLLQTLSLRPDNPFCGSLFYKSPTISRFTNGLRAAFAYQVTDSLKDNLTDKLIFSSLQLKIYKDGLKILQ